MTAQAGHEADRRSSGGADRMAAAPCVPHPAGDRGDCGRGTGRVVLASVARPVGHRLACPPAGIRGEGRRRRGRIAYRPCSACLGRLQQRCRPAARSASVGCDRHRRGWPPTPAHPACRIVALGRLAAARSRGAARHRHRRRPGQCDARRPRRHHARHRRSRRRDAQATAGGRDSAGRRSPGCERGGRGARLGRNSRCRRKATRAPGGPTGANSVACWSAMRPSR
jgi:hypothetical protein